MEIELDRGDQVTIKTPDSRVTIEAPVLLMGGNTLVEVSSIDSCKSIFIDAALNAAKSLRMELREPSYLDTVKEKPQKEQLEAVIKECQRQKNKCRREAGDYGKRTVNHNHLMGMAMAFDEIARLLNEYIV